MSDEYEHENEEELRPSMTAVPPRWCGLRLMGVACAIGTLACGLGTVSEGDAAIEACGARALAASASFQGAQWYAVACSVDGALGLDTEWVNGDGFWFHASLPDVTRALVEVGPAGPDAPCLKLPTEQDMSVSSMVPVWYGGHIEPPLDADTHCLRGDLVFEGRATRGPLTLFVKGNEVWGHAVAPKR